MTKDKRGLYTILFFCLVSILILVLDNRGLRLNIAELEADIIIKKVNNSSLKNVIDKQNKELKSLTLNYNNKIKEFDIYKDNIDFKYKDTKSDECEDIKLILDYIRSNN